MTPTGGSPSSPTALPELSLESLAERVKTHPNGEVALSQEQPSWPTLQSIKEPEPIPQIAAGASSWASAISSPGPASSSAGARARSWTGHPPNPRSDRLTKRRAAPSLPRGTINSNLGECAGACGRGARARPRPIRGRRDDQVRPLPYGPIRRGRRRMGGGLCRSFRTRPRPPPGGDRRRARRGRDGRLFRHRPSSEGPGTSASARHAW